VTVLSAPVRVALVDDYDVVVYGLARMLEPFCDRIEVAQLDVNEPVTVDVDIALYDTFAQPESDHRDFRTLLDNPHAAKVVVYTWSFDPKLVAAARRGGIHGYLAKSLPASHLVEALEAVHLGQIVVSAPHSRVNSAPGLNWPGRDVGLTDREAEILALITQGHSNAEIAALSYLSPNTIKSYIRAIYRKIGAGSRTQAVLWGVNHGFTPSSHRIQDWQTPI